MMLMGADRFPSQIAKMLSIDDSFVVSFNKLLIKQKLQVIRDTKTIIWHHCNHANLPVFPFMAKHINLRCSPLFIKNVAD